jgi:hypothetical protein
MSDSLTAEMLIQKQLDLYNAKDLEAFLALFSDDIQMFEHPSTLLVSGIDGVRERYSTRFKEPNLYAALLKRVVMGNTVIDHEKITRTFPEGPGTLEMIMIYEVENQKIKRSWSIVGEKTLD